MSINGLCTKNFCLSQRTPTPKIFFYGFGDTNFVNWSTFVATTLGFSDKLDHPFSLVFISGNMFPSVTVSSLCLSQAVSKKYVPIYPDELVIGDEIIQACDLHSIGIELWCDNF